MRDTKVSLAKVYPPGTRVEWMDARVWGEPVPVYGTVTVCLSKAHGAPNDPNHVRWDDGLETHNVAIAPVAKNSPAAAVSKIEGLLAEFERHAETCDGCARSLERGTWFADRCTTGKRITHEVVSLMPRR